MAVCMWSTSSVWWSMITTLLSIPTTMLLFMVVILHKSNWKIILCSTIDLSLTLLLMSYISIVLSDVTATVELSIAVIPHDVYSSGILSSCDPSFQTEDQVYQDNLTNLDKIFSTSIIRLMWIYHIVALYPV
jgi:hypothetical protein